MSLIIGILAALLSMLIIKYVPKLLNAVKNLRIVKGFQIRETGVTGIWKDRHDKDAIKAIKKELERASGEILMAGVAFPDFFRPNSDYSVELSNLFRDPSFTFRILLLDPEGACAKERAEIERGRFTIMDIERTIEFLKSVNAQSNITVHIYGFPPIAFLIITNECLFIEQYHFGPPRVDLGCSGGQTIFLRMDKNSNTYKVCRLHFEYIWTKKSEEKMRRMLQQ
jgi:hypothetical protein